MSQPIGYIPVIVWNAKLIVKDVAYFHGNRFVYLPPIDSDKRIYYHV